MKQTGSYLLKQSMPLLQDIRTWIVLFFIIRLIGITSAPIEVGHAWRQCLTAMIARNFTEISPDIRFPRVDTCGAGTGIIGAEFPLLNYLMAICQWLVGPAYWQGRLIVLATSSIGTYYFFRLLSGVFDKHTAFAATLMLLSSAWFEFSRKIMPDTFSLSLVVIALYFAWRYLIVGKPVQLVAYVLLASLGVLSKMPAASLLAVLIVPVFDRKLPWTLRRNLVLASVAVIFTIIIWYFWWVPHLVETYGHQLYFPRTLFAGAMELWHARMLMLEKFTFQAFCSFVGFGAFVVGLFRFMRKPNWRLWLGGSAASLVFFFYMLKTGDVFAFHSYYILPIVPLMAVVAGSFVARVPSKFRWALLLIICAEGVGNQLYDLFPPARNRFLLGLEAIADHYAPPGGLIVVNGGMDPRYMFFLHRRGWSITDAECRNADQMRSITEQGAKFLFVINAEPPEGSTYPILFQDEHVLVLKLGTAYP
ncbi:MAG: ArnT family glycosyltransferase [Flavobacteriales bacterium]